MSDVIIAKLDSFQVMCVISGLMYLLTAAFAWSLGSKCVDNSKPFFGVRLSKPFSFILFLRFFNRKASLITVIMQIINLLALLVYTILYFFLQWKYDITIIDKVFSWIYGINLIIGFFLIVIDNLLYNHNK